MNYTLATWGQRVVAWFVDVLIVYALLGVFTGTSSLILENVLVPLVVSALIVPIGYYVILMTRKTHNGQTLGKQMMKIKVVRDNEQLFDVQAVVVREILGKSVSALPLDMGYFAPIWDKTNRAWHDMIASTHVVQTALAPEPSLVSLMMFSGRGFVAPDALARSRQGTVWINGASLVSLMPTNTHFVSIIKQHYISVETIDLFATQTDDPAYLAAGWIRVY